MADFVPAAALLAHALGPYDIASRALLDKGER
jgi:hypothetical protein